MQPNARWTPRGRISILSLRIMGSSIKDRHSKHVVLRIVKIGRQRDACATNQQHQLHLRDL